MREVNPRGKNVSLLAGSFLISLIIVLILACIKIALEAFLSIIWLTIPLTVVTFFILKSRDKIL